MISGSNITFQGTYGQIGVSLSRKQVIVSGKGTTNTFRVYLLDSSFVPSTSVVVTTVTPAPFSFTWDPTNTYLLATAVSGAASYTINSAGTLQQVSVVNTTSAASCWIAGNQNSNNFYVVNAGQNSVSGFKLGSTGTISRINGLLYTNATFNSEEVALFGLGSAPLDLAISSNDQFLHVILGGRGNLATFAIQSDGTLMSRGEVAINHPGYNAGVNGILAA